jgi:large subunit ribosomal protein L11
MLFKYEKKNEDILELKIKALIKLKLKAQSATTGQPVGPLLGQYGIPLVPFCKEFNERTSNYNSDTEVFVILKLFIDNSYTFGIKMPSLSFLLLRASKIVVESSENSIIEEPIEKVEVPGITTYQLYEVVKYKCAQENNSDLSSRSMTIKKSMILRSLGTLSTISTIYHIGKTVDKNTEGGISFKKKIQKKK